MIKINLLKSEQPAYSPQGLIDPKSGSKRGMVVAAAVAVVALAAFLLWSRQTSNTGDTEVLAANTVPKEAPPALAVTPPEPPPARAAAPPTGEAVEDIVQELTRKAEAAPKPRGYLDLVPSERIDYQLQAVQRILKEVKSITPSDVGFAEFIFTPPGEFYIHGLAYSETGLQQFRNGLNGLQGAEVRIGKLKDVGSASRKAQEFSFYCKVDYPVAGMAQAADKVVAGGKIDGALQDAVQLAGSLGLKLRKPRLTGSEEAGDLKRLVFATETQASYAKLQDFMAQLRASQAPLGVARVSLRASGDDDMVADLDLVAYVGGRAGQAHAGSH